MVSYHDEDGLPQFTTSMAGQQLGCRHGAGLSYFLPCLRWGSWCRACIDITTTPPGRSAPCPRRIWLLIAIGASGLRLRRLAVIGRPPSAAPPCHCCRAARRRAWHRARGGVSAPPGRPCDGHGRWTRDEDDDRSRRARPLGPDDDPEFLLELERRIRESAATASPAVHGRSRTRAGAGGFGSHVVARVGRSPQGRLATALRRRAPPGQDRGQPGSGAGSSRVWRTHPGIHSLAGAG